MGEQSKVYRTWASMLQRCFNKKCPAYGNYGGRGIGVCEPWRGPSGFKAFHAYIGDPPFKGAQLDRYPDNNGDYEPGNVRWATRKKQNRNKRTNRVITFEGKTLCLSDWTDEIGVAVSTLGMRLDRGWSIRRVLTQNTEQRRFLKYKDVRRTLVEWAKIVGVHPRTLTRRLKKRSLSESLTTPRLGGAERLIRFRGKRQSIRKWALDTGIPEQVLYNRFRSDSGWSTAKALTTPPRSYKKRKRGRKKCKQ